MKMVCDMDKDNDNNIVRNSLGARTLNFQPFPCPDVQDIYPPVPTTTLVSDASKIETFPSIKNYQKPRKKRTKLVKIEDFGAKSSGVTKPKYAKKPNPDAPKITMPCTECGKRFWSWKALFGHMRCHPERQWRGINPPPNFRQHQHQASTSGTKKLPNSVSEDDHEVATSLLILANGPSASESPTVTTACNVTSQGTLESDNAVGREALIGSSDVDADVAGPSGLNCSKFECSSCKKVFGSHQALGGHRASHKNVKGCFAITRNDGEEEAPVVDDKGEVKDAGEDKMLMVFGHKCSICLRVFPSGQALGGHKRCHWEKGDEPSGVTQDLNPYSGKEGRGLDLNLPAPVEDDSSCSYSTGLALDLRLGL